MTVAAATYCAGAWSAQRSPAAPMPPGVPWPGDHSCAGCSLCGTGPGARVAASASRHPRRHREPSTPHSARPPAHRAARQPAPHLGADPRHPSDVSDQRPAAAQVKRLPISRQPQPRAAVRSRPERPDRSGQDSSPWSTLPQNHARTSPARRHRRRVPRWRGAGSATR